MQIKIEVSDPEAIPSWILKLFGSGGPENMVVVQAQSDLEKSLAECGAVLTFEHKGMEMRLTYTNSDQSRREAVTREMNKRLG